VEATAYTGSLFHEALAGDRSGNFLVVGPPQETRAANVRQTHSTLQQTPVLQTRHTDARGFLRGFQRRSSRLERSGRAVLAAPGLGGYQSGMSSIGDRVTEPGAAFFIREGEVAVWVDGNIHLKAVTKQGDPVQINVDEARGLIRALENLLLLIE
jgi:hypothetical protein